MSEDRVVAAVPEQVAGVRRVSLGSALMRVGLSTARDALREITGAGSFERCDPPSPMRRRTTSCRTGTTKPLTARPAAARRQEQKFASLRFADVRGGVGGAEQAWT